ncbi:MAG: hypothetical protein ACTSU5_15800 [Promethearchaeota archaeon]
MNLFYLFVLHGLVHLRSSVPVQGNALREKILTRYAQLSPLVQRLIAKKGTIPKVNFYNCLRDLRERDLVDIKHERGIPPRNLYSPTSLGKRVIEEMEQVFGLARRESGGKKKYSLDVLATLSEALGAKLSKWLVDWYEAGLDGEDRELKTERLVSYTGELLSILRNELGI